MIEDFAAAFLEGNSRLHRLMRWLGCRNAVDHPVTAAGLACTDVDVRRTNVPGLALALGLGHVAAVAVAVAVMFASVAAVVVAAEIC